MMQPPRFAAVITALVIAGVFAAMLIFERLRPLRMTVEPKLRRVARNLVTGGIALAVATLLQAPVLLPVSRWACQRPSYFPPGWPGKNPPSVGVVMDREVRLRMMRS